jgi:SAM-dependent methyltransferase
LDNQKIKRERYRSQNNRKTNMHEQFDQWEGRGGMGKPRLGYNKVCNLADFRDQDMIKVIREAFAHEVARFGNSFPIGREYRKHWEVGMAIRSLSDFGILHNHAVILGVGAGTEPTIFWLTTKVKQVFATDLYLQAENQESANQLMMIDPGRFWPSAWNRRRLVVQHMNALQLDYEDESFDGIFSSSAVEHFGDAESVRHAVGEMFRVLKPGGLLSLSTEYRIRGRSPGPPGVIIFSGDELIKCIVGDFAWAPVTPYDFSVSQETLETSQEFSSAVSEVRRHVERYGALYYHKLDWNNYPVLVLRYNDLEWTSFHLALMKRT